MEETQMRYSSLKQDLQRLLDEKEDLLKEKENMNLKIHRMGHQLRQIVAHDKHDMLDMDHIVYENKYLMERLERIQSEKDLANQMGRRYKEALEQSKKIIPRRENNKEHRSDL